MYVVTLAFKKCLQCNKHWAESCGIFMSLPVREALNYQRPQPRISAWVGFTRSTEQVKAKRCNVLQTINSNSNWGPVQKKVKFTAQTFLYLGDYG